MLTQTETVTVEKIWSNEKDEVMITLKIVGAPDYVLSEDHEAIARELNEILDSRQSN